MELIQTIIHRLLDRYLHFLLKNTQYSNTKTFLQADGPTKWFIDTALQLKSVTYPHALHPGHGPERSEGAQGPHGLEGLDAPSPQQRSREVDQRHLVVLVG